MVRLEYTNRLNKKKLEATSTTQIVNKIFFHSI